MRHVIGSTILIPPPPPLRRCPAHRRRRSPVPQAGGPHVRFVVTGFGPFSGVVDNPTAALIELLDQQPKSETSTQAPLCCLGLHRANALRAALKPCAALPPAQSPQCPAPATLPPGPAYRILQSAVLEVAADPVREWLQQLYRSGLGPAPQQPPTDATGAAAANGIASSNDALVEEGPIVMVRGKRGPCGNNPR